MYELLVLSLLMHWPLHAYRIAKIANEIIGPEERLSTGTLSSLLAKLRQAGLIELAPPNSSPFPPDRPSRVLALTLAGRERFLVLMLDTASHSGWQRKIFHIKALHLEFLPVEQQVFLVEHYLAHCRHILSAKRRDSRSVAETPVKQVHMSPNLRQASMSYMRLKLEQWQLELAWAETLRTDLVARLQQPAAASAHA